MASDGNWYPPEQASAAASQPAAAAPASASPSTNRNGMIVVIAAIGAALFALLAVVAVFVVVRHDGGKKWSSSVRSSFIEGCKEDNDTSHPAYTSGECACMADYLASHDVSERDVASASAQSEFSSLSPLLTSKVLTAFDKCT